jgi:hypothetical protein
MKYWKKLIRENKILLSESVSISSINDAIDTHRRIIINYHTKGEDIATGARIIEVYAYGLTKAGNMVIRSFQPYGDTTSRVPSWKFFRLDRISYWKPTNQYFTEPADEHYQGIGNFNPNGDKTMSVVYKIAKFNNSSDAISPVQPSSPKLKIDNNIDIFKTDTEKRMQRLRQQLNNPIKLSDIKTKQGFKRYDNNNDATKQSGPKMKTTPIQQNQNNIEPETVKIDDLKKQLDNNALQQPKDNLFKTDTERNMEKLRQQLQNPRRIDLSKTPKR